MSDSTEWERDSTRDPVHGATYWFEPDGENLWVHMLFEPGGLLPAHKHPSQEERWQVVEGESEVRIGSTKRIVRPADGPQPVAPGVVHSLRNRSTTTAQLKCHVLPAGGVQEFLTESAAAARQGLFFKGGIPRSLRGARWAANLIAKHREDVVMSFPPAPVQAAMIALLARDPR